MLATIGVALYNKTIKTKSIVCRMIGMRQQENEAFRRDLEEAASSKAELANQLSDARAEAGSWQHQLAEARQVQDSLKDRLRLERTLKQEVQQKVEVRLLVLRIACTLCS